MFKQSFSLSDFNVIESLGRGATSHVFKVETNRSHQPAVYAMKVIDKGSPKYRQIAETLQHEIEIHSKLDHENIVKLVCHIEDTHNHYIVLEYCEGGQATKMLKCTMNEQELKSMTHQIAKGLQYLHQQNIVHGDLKPTNILVREGVFVKNIDKTGKKLGDFGFSTKLNNREDRKVKACGTPVFMAPEIVNRQPYGMEVDCWSFGICLLLWYRGYHPYKARSHDDLMKEIKRCKFDLPNEMSDQLKDLILRILVYEPNKRLTIDEILEHPFYRPLDEQSKEDMDSTAQTAYTLKKVKSAGDIKQKKYHDLAKLSTEGLKPQQYKTNRVKATINNDLSVDIEVDSMRIIVSNDGQYIKIYENNQIHVYFLDQLPPKFHRLYSYAFRVVGILKTKNSILLEQTTSQGKFYLMANRTDFYGELGGYTLHHNILEYDINIKENGLKLNPADYVCQHNDQLSKVLRTFLKKEREFLKKL